MTLPDLQTVPLDHLGTSPFRRFSLLPLAFHAFDSLWLDFQFFVYPQAALF
jgi:hypothetical protein